MKNTEYIVFGPTVISATKTPNAIMTPLVKLAIFIFVGIRSPYLLPSFFKVVRGMMLRITPPSTKILANVLPFI